MTAEGARSFLLLLGGGGHCAVVAESALRRGPVTLAFAASQEPEDLCARHAARFVGDVESAAVREAVRAGARVHAAVGDNALRVKWIAELGGAHFETIVDPSAIVSASATLGAGSFVAPRAVVNARASIAQGCILNTGAIVEHDCVLEEGVHVSPGAVLCGAVSVGALSHIGAGAVVLPGVRIGARVRVGAGAVVTRDVESDRTVVGVPANARR